MSSKQIKIFWIGVMVIVIAIVAYHFSSITPKNQTVPEVTQNVGLGSKCNIDAKNYFDNKWVKTMNNTTKNNGDYYKTINLSYRNNYDKTNNSCYVLVNYNFETILNFNVSYLSITYSLVDIYKKDYYGHVMTFGSFNQSISHRDGSKDLLANCNAFGENCTTIDGFLSYVNPYLDK